jgi:rod shape-determining protein MreC
MAIIRLTYGARRLALVLFVLLLAAVFLLPNPSAILLQKVGDPFSLVLELPISAGSAIGDSLSEMWSGYLALQGVHTENLQLRKEIDYLKNQNSQLREQAAATERLFALLDFKLRQAPRTVGAQVVGRDATNWYQSLILNKGSLDGVQVEMGVITPAGVVGRVVKTSSALSVVLLISDPNNAVAGLIQRTRDEGIVQGMPDGSVRLKYIPLLSGVQEGDRVVTSGLVGGFPRGLPIGTISRIVKEEGDLFQAADIVPDVEFEKVEEVLVITDPFGMTPSPDPLKAETSKAP